MYRVYQPVFAFKLAVKVLVSSSLFDNLEKNLTIKSLVSVVRCQRKATAYLEEIPF